MEVKPGTSFEGKNISLMMTEDRVSWGIFEPKINWRLRQNSMKKTFMISASHEVI